MTLCLLSLHRGVDEKQTYNRESQPATAVPAHTLSSPSLHVSLIKPQPALPRLHHPSYSLRLSR